MSGKFGNATAMAMAIIIKSDAKPASIRVSAQSTHFNAQCIGARALRALGFWESGEAGEFLTDIKEPKSNGGYYKNGCIGSMSG